MTQAFEKPLTWFKLGIKSEDAFRFVQIYFTRQSAELLLVLGFVSILAWELVLTGWTRTLRAGRRGSKMTGLLKWYTVICLPLTLFSAFLEPWLLRNEGMPSKQAWVDAFLLVIPGLLLVAWLSLSSSPVVAAVIETGAGGRSLPWSGAKAPADLGAGRQSLSPVQLFAQSFVWLVGAGVKMSTMGVAFIQFLADPIDQCVGLGEVVFLVEAAAFLLLVHHMGLLSPRTLTLVALGAVCTSALHVHYETGSYLSSFAFIAGPPSKYVHPLTETGSNDDDFRHINIFKAGTSLALLALLAFYFLITWEFAKAGLRSLFRQCDWRASCYTVFVFFPIYYSLMIPFLYVNGQWLPLFLVQVVLTGSDLFTWIYYLLVVSYGVEPRPLHTAVSLSVKILHILFNLSLEGATFSARSLFFLAEDVGFLAVAQHTFGWTAASASAVALPTAVSLFPWGHSDRVMRNPFMVFRTVQGVVIFLFFFVLGYFFIHEASTTPGLRVTK